MTVPDRGDRQDAQGGREAARIPRAKDEMRYSEGFGAVL